MSVFSHFAPPPASREGYTQGAASGCTADGCGSQTTELVCGCHGRRCTDHNAHEEQQQ